MLNCPYCNDNSFKQFAGLSVHIKKTHPSHWHGSLESSLPEGRDKASLGTRQRHPLKGKPPVAAHMALAEHRRSSGRTPFSRKPINDEPPPPVPLQRCLWCDYQSSEPKKLSAHIRVGHPKKWRGTLALSLGRKGRAFLQALTANKRIRNRMYQRQWARKQPIEVRREKWREDSFKRRTGFAAPRSRWQRMTAQQKRRHVEYLKERREALKLGMDMQQYRHHRAQLGAPNGLTEQGAAAAAPAMIKHCPECGHNLLPYQIALGMMQRATERVAQYASAH